MKLIMTLLVRDEEDIIASNIDYHLHNGIDFIIATDNLSTDRTADILKSYEKRGLLYCIHENEDDYTQHAWVTRMARLACTEFGADWIINNDADEFWWPHHGNLKTILEEVESSTSAVSAERSNFLPRPVSSESFFADILTIREQNSLNALGTPLPPKVCHRAYADIEVAQGNHSVARNGIELATVRVPITILHFPLRSYKQFANKIAKGGAAYARNRYLPAGIGITWRYLHQLWEQGELEAYYNSQVLNDAAIDRGLKEGTLIQDERLKMFFSGLSGQ